MDIFKRNKVAMVSVAGILFLALTLAAIAIINRSPAQESIVNNQNSRPDSVEVEALVDSVVDSSPLDEQPEPEFEISEVPEGSVDSQEANANVVVVDNQTVDTNISSQAVQSGSSSASDNGQSSSNGAESVPRQYASAGSNQTNIGASINSNQQSLSPLNQNSTDNKEEQETPPTNQQESNQSAQQTQSGSAETSNNQQQTENNNQTSTNQVSSATFSQSQSTNQGSQTNNSSQQTRSAQQTQTSNSTQEAQPANNNNQSESTPPPVTTTWSYSASLSPCQQFVAGTAATTEFLTGVSYSNHASENIDEAALVASQFCVVQINYTNTGPSDYTFPNACMKDLNIPSKTKLVDSSNNEYTNFMGTGCIQIPITLKVGETFAEQVGFLIPKNVTSFKHVTFDGNTVALTLTDF